MKHLIAFIFALAVFQSAIAVQPETEATNDWIHRAVFYEIFVRSFQDSNGDGIGDFNGVTQRLDYLQSLGVHGIWLMPIFASPTYHGYDTIDYRKMNPDYGTVDDFKKLLHEAHARDIRIILDIALNHTSSYAPRFQAESQVAPKTVGPKNTDAWYLWFSKAISPWVGIGKFHNLTNGRLYYSSFSINMPDVNWLNPEWRDEVNNILHYWSDIGVDGFRLDAARYYVKGPHGESDIDETHQYIQDFVQDLKKDFRQTMFVGEVWANSKIIAPYVNSGRQLDLAFNFPLAFGLQSALKKETAADFITAARSDLHNIKSQDHLAPFLTNHDMIRIATQVSGKIEKLKLAAITLLTLPGTPYIYYGEELGLPNGAGRDDRQKRTPMQWDDSTNFGFSSTTPWMTFADPSFRQNVASEDSDANSLLSTYRHWINLRNNEPALQRGDFQVLQTNNSAVAAYTRTLDDDTDLVILNFGGRNLNAVKILKDGQTLATRDLAPYTAALVTLNSK